MVDTTEYGGRPLRAVGRTLDSQFPHSMAKGIRVEFQDFCRAFVAFDHPSGLLKSREDMLALDLLQGGQTGDVGRDGESGFLLATGSRRVDSCRVGLEAVFDLER